MSKPKLLWHSNAPWAPTGYGNQTGLFTPRLLNHYDVRVSSFYGLEGTTLTWEGIKVLAGLGGTYGNEALPHHATRFFGKNRDGLVLTLMDVWVLNANMCSQFDMACWTPVDHQPAPPRVTDFLEESQAVPLAMSQFGMRQLEQFHPIYVPHGVDTNVYRPIPTRQAREQLGFDPDAFIVGMVAANKGNPSRKSFVTVLEAFAELHRKHENAKLYLHTDIIGEWSGGVPLTPLIEALGLPDDAIGYVDPYAIHFHPLSPATMAMVYSAFDVLINPAMGEGFGVPVLEAQACGTPVIVSDFSAMPEMCGAGWTIEGRKWWTPQNAWQIQPDLDDLVSALTECYRLPTAQRARLAERAREHAVKYDVDRILTEHMLPGLQAVRARLDACKPTMVPARVAA